MPAASTPTDAQTPGASIEPEPSYDIAVIFPDWYAFLHNIMEGILEIRGVRHRCNFRNFIANDFSQKVKFPKGYRPDGVLVSYDDTNIDAAWLSDLDVPVVNIFSSVEPKHPSVSNCIQSLAQIVVEHFSTLNFQQIGLLGTRSISEKSTYIDIFYQSLISLCDERAIPHWRIDVPDGIRAGSWSKLEQAAPQLRDRLLQLESRTGIYCFHDTRGRLLADYCTELGVKVPEEVGILGRFDSINARLCTPELSSVVMPAKQMGGQAIQLLVNLIEKRPVDELHPQIQLNEIKVRESTVGQSDPDMIVLRARTMIRDHACNGLTVDELIQSLPLARSTFEKRYRALTGSSPAQEIRKIRIDKARQLLLTTQKTIESIATEIGFNDARPFVVFFKREAGLTPGEYRNTYQS